MEDLTGKVALITGGASGIGLGMAQAFAATGMRVAIADVDEAALESAAKGLREAGARVEALTLDVRDREGWQAVVDATEAALGPIQVLCNNAGVTAYEPLVQQTFDYWDWVIGVNLTGTFNGVRTLGPRMIARRVGGHIVNTASIAGLYANRNFTVGVYTASKFGVVGLSEMLRREMAAHDIGVSVLCPGLVRTNIGPNVARMRPDAATPRELTEKQKQLRSRSRSEGMDPRKVGERVVKAIRANESHIITHPEFRPLIEERCREVLACFGESADPDLPVSPNWRDLA
jgi:2-hydroxycyclohexanecarboxyl-CoA dehydrogenase